MHRKRCNESAATCVLDCADADGDGHGPLACGGDDCDDADANAFPGNPELCDLEAHDEDCDPGTLGARDVDGDGVTDVSCCNGSTCGQDCNDVRRGVSPFVPEVCNGIDDDCDGVVDEGLLLELYLDADHDGVGEASRRALACPGQPGFAGAAGDCDDESAATRPTAPEICDGEDNDCDGTTDEATLEVPWYVDADGDGWGVVDADRPSIDACTPPPGRAIRVGDCNDGDADVSPTARERCNGLDDDCNGRADYAVAARDTEDDDEDGAPDARCGAVAPDCDDRDPYSSAGSPEICDGRDNDCDGTLDEGAAPTTWHADVDGDAHGDPDDTISSCEIVPGRVLDGSDCDDDDQGTHPGAIDACQGRAGTDDDCDGRVDEAGVAVAFYDDLDGDGYGAGAPVLACIAAASTAARGGDCDDGDARVSPAGLDDCVGLGGVDDDCDGRTDETMTPRSYWLDGDGDGYGAGVPTASCSPPSAAVFAGGDCNDADPARSPAALDDCSTRSGVDDDCDGRTDEAFALRTYYRDADGDGSGTTATTTMACAAPSGYVALASDCDDTRSAVHPGAAELCANALDDDCDGALDCADSGCAGMCAAIRIVSGDGQSAPLHTLATAPLVVRVEDGAGMPLVGRSVTLVTRGVSSPTGLSRITDASGSASFTLRAGPFVGTETITVRASGATDAMVSLSATAPAAGTLFSVANGDDDDVYRGTGPAWTMSSSGVRGEVATTSDGSIYWLTSTRVHRIAPDGSVEVVAGGGSTALASGVDARSISLNASNTRMTVDGELGILYLQTARCEAYAVDLSSSVVTRVAGTGTCGTGVASGAATSVILNGIHSIAPGPSGSFYLTEGYLSGERLRVVDSSGFMRTLVAEGSGTPAVRLVSNMLDVAVVPGSLDVMVVARVSIAGAATQWGVLRVDPGGNLTHVAGAGSDPTSDGIDARMARFGSAPDIAVLDGGDVVVAIPTADGPVVRLVDAATGTIRTLSGAVGVVMDAGDGGPAAAGRFQALTFAEPWLGTHILVSDGESLRAIW